MLDSAAGRPLAKTIGGNIGFADQVVVRFAGDGLKLADGEYELINAEGDIFNFRAEGWTIDGDFGANRRLSVCEKNGSIVLSVTSPGMFMIVR